ncbi:MAG: ribosome silencing factor [Elusimicrobia bacterium]|nr:ribosome silencing factor [Elusimicrobiota bacterium]
MTTEANALAQGRYYKKLAVQAARAADDKKAEQIVLLHVAALTGVADYVMIASCASVPQLEAVEDHIKKTFKDDGLLMHHRDGRLSEKWRVLDYGGLLIHLMHPAAREHYRLETIYQGAKKVRWEASGA